MVNDLEDVLMQHGVVVRELQVADAEDSVAPWVVTCYRKRHGVYAFPGWRHSGQSLWPWLAASIRLVAAYRRDGSIAAHIKRREAEWDGPEFLISGYESVRTDSDAFYELFSPEEWELVVEAAETFG